MFHRLFFQTDILIIVPQNVVLFEFQGNRRRAVCFRVQQAAKGKMFGPFKCIYYSTKQALSLIIILFIDDSAQSVWFEYLHSNTRHDGLLYENPPRHS